MITLAISQAAAGNIGFAFLGLVVGFIVGAIVFLVGNDVKSKTVAKLEQLTAQEDARVSTLLRNGYTETHNMVQEGRAVIARLKQLTAKVKGAL